VIEGAGVAEDVAGSPVAAVDAEAASDDSDVASGEAAADGVCEPLVGPEDALTADDGDSPIGATDAVAALATGELVVEPDELEHAAVPKIRQAATTRVDLRTSSPRFTTE